MNSHQSVTRVLVSIVVLVALLDRWSAAQDPPMGLNLESTARSRAKVWAAQPAPSGDPVAAARVRIVDFGNDFLRGGDCHPRHHFHCHRYTLVRNPETGLWEPCPSPVAEDHSVDVDRDGRLDDTVAYHEFSLTRPFNPVAPWYDTLAGTPRWYGGQAIYQANSLQSGFSEDGVNQDHDGQFAWPRENWAVFHETCELYSPYRLAANYFWMKHDFLNGGADFRVTFDQQSRLGLVLKRYFMGVESVRFLVRDATQSYVSEQKCSGVGTHSLQPLETRWARYNPQPPHDIYFDPAAATFEPHDFTEVTAVGVYVAKDQFIPAYFGYKWYAFECDAVVHRRARPSENLKMVRVQGPGGTGDFYIGATEVPYDFWKTIYRQARSNNFVPPSQGFGFEKDGDMGSMDFGDHPHSQQEPATDFTLHDAVAWCNALSELESRVPVYYEDAEHTRPLHEVRFSPALRRPERLASIHVKWDADGYRLPTPSEWQAAWKGQAARSGIAVLHENSRGQTQPVGSCAPNERGLHDMLGNVWELTWSFGDSFDPTQNAPLLVLGGDFLSPTDPTKRSASVHGDRPYHGSYNVGLRVVRREGGGRVPEETSLAAEIPVWRIAPDTVTGPGEAASVPAVKPDLVAIPGTAIEMAQYETTFRLWRQVRDWALAHGYETDYDGDMGSMDYWGFDPAGKPVEPPAVHRPDEPVTDITFYDMAVWCNALSEMLGRRPVYYGDEDCQQVYKRAVKFRPIQFHFPEDYIEKYGRPESADTPAVAMGAEASASPPGAFHADAEDRVLPSLYQDPRADGFRLPSPQEFVQAVLPDQQKYPWGDDPRGVFENAWLFDNAEGTTHRVGEKRPTSIGLYDAFGNASELSTTMPIGEKCPVRLGGSVLDLAVGSFGGIRKSDAPPPTWPYCDTGFRVVRQVPGGDSRDSSLQVQSSSRGRTAGEGPKPSDAPRVRIDLARFDPLQGKVHRGNLFRNGVFQATGLPNNPRVAWTFATGGPVKSSPVVVDGLVHVGSYDGHVYAIHAGTGQLVWKVDTGGVVSGSAAVSEGTVFIASEAGTLLALDARTGTERWRYAIGGQPAGSPAVAYGTVFVVDGGKAGRDRLVMRPAKLFAIDARSGELVWEVPGGANGVAALATDGQRLYASTGLHDGRNTGFFDLATGEILFNGDGSHQARIYNSVAVTSDRWFAPFAMRGTIHGYRERDLLWRAAPLPQSLEREVNTGLVFGHQIFADLAATDHLVLAGCNDGKLYAFSAETGTRQWELATRGPIHSGPSVAQDVVYFGSWDGHLYAANLEDGSLRWKQKLGDMPQSAAEQYSFGPTEGARIISSPWLGDGAIYVGCDNGNVYKLN